MELPSGLDSHIWKELVGKHTQGVILHTLERSKGLNMLKTTSHGIRLPLRQRNTR